MTTPLAQCRAFDKQHGKALTIKLGRVSDAERRATSKARDAWHALVDDLAFHFVDTAPMWKQERMASLDDARLDFTRESLDVVDAWACKVASQVTTKLRDEHVVPQLSGYLTKTMFLRVPGLCWVGGGTFASRGTSSGDGPFRYRPEALVSLLFDSGLRLGPTMDLVQQRVAESCARRGETYTEGSWPCPRWAR